jgi:hypothetical protein
MPKVPIQGAECSATGPRRGSKRRAPPSQVAAKHCVTDAVLEYRLYKRPERASVKSDPLALLPGATAADAAAGRAMGDLGVSCTNLSPDLIVVLGFHSTSDH